jgi:hypothetical protein
MIIVLYVQLDVDSGVGYSNINNEMAGTFIDTCQYCSIPKFSSMSTSYIPTFVDLRRLATHQSQRN